MYIFYWRIQIDDMGDANILLKFREKKRTKRERELYLVTFFLDLSCITKHPFNQSNEKLTKNKINIFFMVGTGLANFVYLCTLSRKLNS